MRGSEHDHAVRLTVEEALRRAEDTAALLRYLADLAAGSPEAPDRSALSGLADACGDIADTLKQARHSFSQAHAPNVPAGDLRAVIPAAPLSGVGRR